MGGQELLDHLELAHLHGVPLLLHLNVDAGQAQLLLLQGIQDIIGHNAPHPCGVEDDRNEKMKKFEIQLTPLSNETAGQGNSKKVQIKILFCSMKKNQMNKMMTKE